MLKPGKLPELSDFFHCNPMQSFFEKEDLNEDRYFHQNEDIPKYHVNRSSHELENRKRTTYYIYACVCDRFIVFIDV